MQCTACGTINPAQARFCMGCGIVLVQGIVCNQCHTLLPPQARFCYQCGNYLAQQLAQQTGMTLPSGTFAAPASGPAPAIPTIPTAPVLPVSPLPATSLTGPSPAPLVAYAPPPAQPGLPTPRSLDELRPTLIHYLTDEIYKPLERIPKDFEIIAVRDHLSALLETVKTYLPWPVVQTPQPAGVPAGRMYQGVFLFGDVSGFTPLSEKLKVLGQEGAEIITRIINALFTDLVTVLFDHGGTLLKFGGDALLGLFPAETEEEMAAGALRAAQAALAMQAVLQKEQFSAIEVQGEKRALAIKCGIAAGPYFAAHIGTPPGEHNFNGTMAYVTTGDTVNQAEQSEGHANPGEVAMTRVVAGLLGERVELGPVNKSPDENFFRLISAPPMEHNAQRLEMQEPPDGDPLAQIAYLAERLDRLTPYLSDELVARLVARPRGAIIRPENRPVTVMFANYKGISKLIEKMGYTDPDLITQHLNNYFVSMATIVERFEGTVARMDQYSVGDRLVIFFGAPRAHEDDPQRAAFTALEMQQVVRSRFAALRTATGVYRFEQRIGINTGYLFAGNAGAPGLRQEYTLMGDDINMAARLMSNAPFGEIYISKRTKENLEDLFDLEDKGELKVKGKEIRIPTFRIISHSARASDASCKSIADTPLVGRQEELQILYGRSAEFAESRRGQIISIHSNGGLGKTRLLCEMANHLYSQASPTSPETKIRWVDARALSFSEQMSYWLANQLMRGLLQLKPETSEDDALYALNDQCETLLGDRAMDAVPYLAHMMGLNLGEEWAWVLSLDPKVRQQQTFWAARELLDTMASQAPVVMALDDLHWADEASLALIENLLVLANKAPVMFCLLFRPLHDKGCWRLHEIATRDFPHRYTSIELDNLDRASSADLLNNLLPGAVFAPRIYEEILNKAAGNPFYLREVVQALKESKAVNQTEEGEWQVVSEKIADIAVPDTLQAAIVARIDRLSEDARQALQMASVIGRKFRLEILYNLAEARAEIDIWLAQLERGGIVAPEQVTRDPIYSFPDALIQEVAYDSLPVQNRQQIHRRIAETLEAAVGESPEAASELLAFHFSRGDDPDRAKKYLEIAARNARNKYANETAIQYYEQFLKLQRKAGDLAGQASTLYTLGVIAYEIGDYERAKPWLSESVALREQLGDTTNQGWSVMYVGMVDLKQANYAESFAHHQKAMQLAQARGDVSQEGIHLTNQARVTMRLGQYELALEQFQRSLEMKRQVQDANGIGFSLFYTGLVHIYQGRYDQAQVDLQAALEAWSQVPKNERQMAYYHYGAGLLAFEQNLLDQASDHLQQAQALSARLVLKAEMIEILSAQSQVHLALGDIDLAREKSDQALKLLATQKDVEEVQQIYLNHYRLLNAVKDTSAGEYLQQAAEIMQERAQRIQDPQQRQIYLEQVRVNQEINALLQVA